MSCIQLYLVACFKHELLNTACNAQLNLPVTNIFSALWHICHGVFRSAFITSALIRGVKKNEDKDAWPMLSAWALHWCRTISEACRAGRSSHSVLLLHPMTLAWEWSSVSYLSSPDGLWHGAASLQQHAGAVELGLPSFWCKELHVWIDHVEILFHLQRFDLTSWYYHVILTLSRGLWGDAGNNCWAAMWHIKWKLLKCIMASKCLHLQQLTVRDLRALSHDQQHGSS